MGFKDAVRDVKDRKMHNDLGGMSPRAAPPPPKRDHWPTGLCSCNTGVCCWGMWCCCMHTPQLLVRSGKHQPGEPNLSGCCDEQPIPLSPCSCVNAPLCWLISFCPFVGWCEVCEIRKNARDQWLDTDNYQSTTPRWIINCLCCCCNLNCACCECMKCFCCCCGDDQVKKCDLCLVATCCPCCANIQAHVLMDEELGPAY
uniref:Uncharacterized protein n=1 Tax=Paramoeba aestuarina TaxID=180227 RepID=A0A7S4UG85_9EUKA